MDTEFSNIYIYIYPTRNNVTQFILSGNCSTCYGWYLHPSSGAHKTVSTASCICQTVTATCRWRQVAVTVWQIPDVVDTVLGAPDDGWRYHPKHVEQFPDTKKTKLHPVGYILGYICSARTHALQIDGILSHYLAAYFRIFPNHSISTGCL